MEGIVVSSRAIEDFVILSTSRVSSNMSDTRINGFNKVERLGFVNLHQILDTDHDCSTENKLEDR